MATPQPPEKIWYEASCHCGAIQYKFKIPSIEEAQITNCNCSICVKNGYLNLYPLREDIVFHSGKDQMKSYHFKSGEKSHMFCPSCGSSLMIDFHDKLREYFHADVLAVNVRMIKEIDVDKLNLRQFDGKNLL